MMSYLLIEVTEKSHKLTTPHSIYVQSSHQEIEKKREGNFENFKVSDPFIAVVGCWDPLTPVVDPCFKITLISTYHSC